MFSRLSAAEVDKKLEMRESLLKWSAIFHVVHGAVRLGKIPIEKNPRPSYRKESRLIILIQPQKTIIITIK